MRRRPIRGTTIVVVGATSGVGRASALSLACCGANLVIVARDGDDVAEMVRECTAFGVDAVGVVGDVADPGLSMRVAARAVERFGVIDTWINAASGLVVGDIVAQPVADIEQIVATNVLGTTFASRAAIQQFRAQGHGVLINIASLLALIPNPLVPTYVMSKFAIRGLSFSLHEATAGTDVRVSTILPGPIDTPMFQHAANYSGKALRAIPPAESPERVAAAVVRSVRRPRRQRTVGLTGTAIAIGHRLFPRLVEFVVARAAAALVVTQREALPTEGSLFTPSGPAAVSGEWRHSTIRRRLGDAVGRRAARRTA